MSLVGVPSAPGHFPQWSALLDERHSALSAVDLASLHAQDRG